jgi:hypothetical protein
MSNRKNDHIPDIEYKRFPKSAKRHDQRLIDLFIQMEAYRS